MTSVRLFIGGLTRIDEHGQWTGIYKHEVGAPLLLSFDGLAGDFQADRRVHGGPEKAVHHYAVENYGHLAERFPAIAAQLVAGRLGENVSASGFDVHTVHIGDIFRLDRALLQVSQPRSPCWKIDHRYACARLARTSSAASAFRASRYRVTDSTADQMRHNSKDVSSTRLRAVHARARPVA